MTQHTKGPWNCKPSHKSDAEYVIFNKDDNYLTTNDDEHEANARLIAAAPELLACCEAYLNAHTQSALDNAIEKTRAAIAKARG